MDIIEDWVQTYKASVRNQSRKNLQDFLDYIDMKSEQALALRKEDQNRTFERLCLKWLNHMLEEKGLAQNTGVNRLGTVRSWFKYHDLDLRFKRGEVPKNLIKPQKFSLTIDHVRKMLEYAGIFEKALIHMAMETGLRISDLLALKKADIENLLQQDLPSTMEVLTQKEGVIARIFMSQENAEVLKLYLPTLPENEKLLFPKNEDTVNKSVKKLFEQAFPDLQLKPSMHDFRRLFMSTASNMNVNTWRIKFFTGKTVPPDILTYLRDQDLKGDFIKIKSRLTVQQVTAQTPQLKQILEAVVSALTPLVEQELAKKGITLKRSQPTTQEWIALHEQLLTVKEKEK